MKKFTNLTFRILGMRNHCSIVSNQSVILAKKLRSSSTILSLVLIIAMQPNGVFAQEPYTVNDMKCFNLNTCWFDPSEEAQNCLSFGSNAEIIWGWLLGEGMSEYGAAGIMGNMSVESGFNPFQIQIDAPLRTYDAMIGSSESNSAFGLVQWDGSRRVELLKSLAAKYVDYKQYVSDSYGKNPDAYTNAPEDVKNKTILFELDYMYKEATPGGSRSTTWSKLLSAQSATTAANIFEEIFEGSTRTAGGPHASAAETIYNKYKGSVSGDSSQSGCDSSGTGGLISGGMSVEQARAFMQKYIDFSKGKTGRGLKTVSYNGKSFQLWFSGCSGGALANCSTFSEFFVGAYTSGKQAFPNGGLMVGQLLATNSGFIDGGHIPKVYAVFSRSSGDFGHTGVVLGIDKTRNKILIGQAGCGAPLIMDDYTVAEYPLSTWTNNSDYSYAYTDNILQGDIRL